MVETWGTKENAALMSGEAKVITDSEFNQSVVYVKKNYGRDLSQKRVLVGGRLDNYLVRNGYEKT